MIEAYKDLVRHHWEFFLQYGWKVCAIVLIICAVLAIVWWKLEN